MNPFDPANDHFSDQDTDNRQLLLADEPARADEDAAIPDNFIVTYTTLMILLLAFFLVLFSMATTSTGKFTYANKSIKNEFSTMGINSARKTLAFMYSLTKIKGSLNTTVNPALKEEAAASPNDGSGSSQQNGQKKITKVYWEENENVNVTAKMGDLILLGVNAERQKKDLLLRVPALKLFYPNAAKITPAGKVIITNMLNIIKTDFERIAIHSYTDDSNAGSADLIARDSFVLSTERARAVAQEIADQLEIPLEDIPFYGYGKYRSYDPKSKLGPNPLNNRIEFWIRELWTHDENAKNVAPAAG